MPGSIGIPKRLGHIWIGPKYAPTEWMQTWRDKHPDWDYTLYDNDVLTGRTWRNQPLIAEYFRRRQYAGVSDLMRYEILYEEGGFLPEADSVCLRPCDELFDRACAYTVYENEERKPGNCSPLLASDEGNHFAHRLVVSIKRRFTPETLQQPWKSVGNRYMRLAIARMTPDIVIFPSHYFVPQFKNEPRYSGDGPIYADQKWGTTLGHYKSPGQEAEDDIHYDILAQLEARI